MNNISHNIKKYREINNITQRELSEISGVTYSTITKLEAGVYENPTIDTLVNISNVLGIGVENLLEKNFNREKIEIIHDNKKAKFTFIDLFAGIGGIRLGFEKFGGKSVFSSEIDKFACKTYEANFKEAPFGDITKIDEKDIPDHDVLLAGFPCQPFSIAGVSKKNSLGKDHGFFDETKGTLFFDILRITKEKRPKILFLENVKNLMSHDKGRTFKVIVNSLINLDYNVYYKVYDGKAFVPQHRERTIIVCFDNNYFKGRENFSFPKLPEKKLKLADILEDNVEEKYTLSDKLWDYLQKYAEKHRIKGNGFGYGMPDLNSYSRTLSARYYKDGSEILISQKNKNPRKLTPRECARLQGFPESFIIPVSNTQAYKQFGNAVVVPLIEFLAKDIVKILEEFNG